MQKLRRLQAHLSSPQSFSLSRFVDECRHTSSKFAPWGPLAGYHEFVRNMHSSTGRLGHRWLSVCALAVAQGRFLAGLQDVQPREKENDLGSPVQVRTGFLAEHVFPARGFGAS